MLHRPAHGAPDAGRHHAVVVVTQVDVVQRLGIALVAGEQLVASFSRQHHLHVVGRQARDEIQRHAPRVTQGPVLVPYQRGERITELVGAHYHFVMVGAIGSGDGSGMLELIRLLLREPNGEGLDRLIDEPAHDRRNGRRVDATREEHSQWHVRHQAHAYRFGKALGEFRDELLIRLVRAAGGGEAQVPVLSNLQCSVSPPQRMARRQPLDAGEQRCGSGGGAVGEIVRQGRVIQLRSDRLGRERGDHAVAAPPARERLQVGQRRGAGELLPGERRELGREGQLVAALLDGEVGEAGTVRAGVQAGVDEGEMRRIDEVLDHPRRARLPDLVAVVEGVVGQVLDLREVTLPAAKQLSESGWPSRAAPIAGGQSCDCPGRRAHGGEHHQRAYRPDAASDRGHPCRR